MNRIGATLGWLVGRFVGQSLGHLVDWFGGRSVNQSVCQLIRLVGPSVDLSVGPSVGWSFSQSVRWLVGPMDSPVTAHLTKRFIGHFIWYFKRSFRLYFGSFIGRWHFIIARGTKECRKFGLCPSCLCVSACDCVRLRASAGLSVVAKIDEAYFHNMNFFFFLSFPFSFTRVRFY